MSFTCIQCHHVVAFDPDRRFRCANCGSRALPLDGQGAHPEVAAKMPQGPDRDGALTADGLERDEPSEDRSRTASVVSLVAGLMFFVPLVAQAIGIVAGMAALCQSRHGQGRTRLAWVGLALSTTLLAAWIAVFAVMIPGSWNSAGGSARVSGSIGATGGPITGGFAPVMVGESNPQAAWQWQTIAGQVQKASVSFQRDYGRWPASIDAMRGRSLPLEFTLPTALTYRPVPKGLAADPQWILLVSDPTPWGLGTESPRKPHRLIQRLGGATQIHPADEVARWLAD